MFKWIRDRLLLQEVDPSRKYVVLSPGHPLEDEEKWASIAADTPTRCSTHCCGNQRLTEGSTKQELVAEIETQEQLEEI